MPDKSEPQCPWCAEVFAVVPCDEGKMFECNNQQCPLDLFIWCNNSTDLLNLQLLDRRVADAVREERAKIADEIRTSEKTTAVEIAQEVFGRIRARNQEAKHGP